MIYCNNKSIEPTNLKTLIKPWIENNHIIFSLYDLESTYGPFLEMNAIINAAYEEARQGYSKSKFNNLLNELSIEERTQTKLQIPMKHIWSYSIPHYNTVVKQENSFFGLKVSPID